MPDFKNLAFLANASFKKSLKINETQKLLEKTQNSLGKPKVMKSL